MKIKVLREFIGGVETYPAGISAELPDELAERVIGVGWAELEDGENHEDGENPEEDEWPKHKGFGNYELSNGKIIKGKKEAIEDQQIIDNDATESE